MTDTTRRTSFEILMDEGVLEIGDGYRAKNEELGGAGPIFLRAGHVRNTHIDFEDADRFHEHLSEVVASKMARPGDTVITTKGNSTGRTSYVEKGMPPFAYSPHLSYWRTRRPDLIDSLFLRYWARGAEFQQQLDGMKASTDMAPYLSLADQRRLRISLPPIGQQRNSGLLLSALDDKIALNRRMNRTLEATAAALFRSWFVDFDPIVAKAEGRRASGVPSVLHEQMPAAFTADASDTMPLGWRIGTAQDLASFVHGRNFTPGATGTGRMVIRIAELGGEARGSTVFNDVSASDDNIARAGDLLFSWSGSLRVARWHGEESLINQHIFKVVCSTWPQWFVHHHLDLALPEFQEIAAGKATTMGHIKREHLSQLRLALPTSQVVESAGEVIEPLYKRIHSNERENRTLAALRDTLLPQLLSGAIRLRDAERAVGAAV